MTQVDRLAEATYGAYHMTDPGMDDFEGGWEEFAVGMRVEVRTHEDGMGSPEGSWRTGTIREDFPQNGRMILADCDDQGPEAVIPVYTVKKGDLWSMIRTIPRENRGPNLEQSEDLPSIFP